MLVALCEVLFCGNELFFRTIYIQHRELSISGFNMRLTCHHFPALIICGVTNAGLLFICAHD